MKKRIPMLASLFILVILGIIIFISDHKQIKVKVNAENEISLLLSSSERKENLYPWYDENSDIYYFFIPAFVDDHFLYFEPVFGKKIFLNGSVLHGSRFEWEQETVYEIGIAASSDKVQVYHIKFVQSSNIPAIFINTESGSMEYLHQNKNNEEKGSMDVIWADGSIDYCGKIEKISGRGNSTWDMEKKPYAITLPDEIPLCGMPQGKKWKLLALAREGSKMNNKLVYDMAEELMLAHTTNAKWVDLYLNGKYNGIYMLNEAVTIADKENPNAPTGYLLELDDVYYGEAGENAFITLSGNPYVIHEPKSVSLDEKNSINEFIQKIEDMLISGNEEYRDYLDLNSFAKRFLINEITLNIDTNVTSVYFYKYYNEDLCYAGPVWDYDMSLGEFHNPESDAVDYEETTLEYVAPGFNWSAYLCLDSEFQKKVLEYYRDFLPYMQELLEHKIDGYMDQIKASVHMDSIRWEPTKGDYPGHYTTWEDNVRYIKYFLANRLNYLNQLWGIPYETFTAPTNGKIHEVFFEKDGDTIEIRQVIDGDVIMDPPALSSEHTAWYYLFSDEPYSEKIPVYEDVTFYIAVKYKDAD